MDDGSVYGFNVGQWLKDHKAWQLTAGQGGFGYRARPAGGGQWIEASSLDELHERVTASGLVPRV